MRNTLMSLLATKAKTGALVAGTALATTAVVGGGAVALQTVGSEQAASQAGSSATPTVGIGKKGKGRGAENRSATATANLESEDAPTTVTFVCDPAKSHGENVSAFARSLPEGAGRGELVSQAAQSDCGKDVKPSPTATDAAVEKAKAQKAEKTAKATAVKPAKPAKPARTEAPAKPAKPAKAEQAERAESGNETAEDARTSERPEDSRPDDAGSKSQGKGGRS